MKRLKSLFTRRTKQETYVYFIGILLDALSGKTQAINQPEGKIISYFVS